MFDRICLWSCQALDFCLDLLIHAFNFSACVWSIYFLFPLGSVPINCAFLRICPFLPGCHFIGIYLPVVVSYDPLYFCDVSCIFSFSISNFIDLSSHCFFLMSLDKHLSILFIFSEKQLLVSLIFSIVFFISISFISALIFMISFTNFGLCLFFFL